jgi:uncharacterized protein YgbK (DUF1537 family)
MPRVLILADDLSGAADCGIACVNAGISTLVSLGLPSNGVAADVLSVDADTRGLNAGDAAERMQDLVHTHAHDPSILLFKKIDSTLRGHLGPELVAVLKARRAVVPGAVAIFAPAFPSNGRTTERGMHYVHGEPLHETETWKNEGMTGEAHIPTMLASSDLNCAHLDLDLVRSATSVFDAAVSHAASTADVLVCDAVSDGDLFAIASAAATLGHRSVWVGSAGLAHQLPRATGFSAKSEEIVPHLPNTAGPILFVIGSSSRTTKHQAVNLLSRSDIHGIVVPPEVLLAGPEGPDWSDFTADLRDAVAQGEDVILLCGPEPRIEAAARPRLAFALAEMTAALHGQVGALVASGGETARKVLDRWAVSTLLLHGELERGVPVSSTTVDQNRPLTVITKAGDFGQPYTLVHCREWLKQKRNTK